MKKEKRITIRLNEEEYEKINKIAKKLEIPISKLIRNLTLVGLEDAEIFDKLGILEIAKGIRNFKEKATKLGTKIKNSKNQNPLNP